MKISYVSLLVGMAFITTTTPVWGQGSFKGYMFGDVYYLASHDDQVGEEPIEGANGLWFRRIYLTFDWKFSDTWSARLRTEMNSPGNFTTRAKLEPVAKNAYVRWTKGNHQITLGLSGTPTWGVIDPFWGYRSLEKTLLDLQRLGSSTDIGVAFKGSLDQAKKVRYHLMLANGNSNSSETNEGKKVMLALGVFPSDTIVLEGYVDYDELPGENDRVTVQGFFGFQQEAGRIGVQYVFQNRDVEGGESVALNGLSVFGAVKLSEKVNAFARYDGMFDPNPDAGKIAYLPFDPGFKSNMVLVGLDFVPHEQVHLMPNVEAVFYESGGPDATVLPRLTFYVIFK
ncbi:MAG: hypothetical protein ACE10K_16230 [Rhodothermales bacterium]